MIWRLLVPDYHPNPALKKPPGWKGIFGSDPENKLSKLSQWSKHVSPPELRRCFVGWDLMNLMDGVGWVCWNTYLLNCWICDTRGSRITGVYQPSYDWIRLPHTARLFGARVWVWQAKKVMDQCLHCLPWWGWAHQLPTTRGLNGAGVWPILRWVRLKRVETTDNQHLPAKRYVQTYYCKLQF